MAEDWDKIKWEQLNQRSRWYSSQLWYVPFAYVGIVGLASDKILSLPAPLSGVGLLFLGIFSTAVLVHVLAIKFYERRAVQNMRGLEGDNIISSGGSPWYLSFVFYVGCMVTFASYFFVGYGFYLLEIFPTLLNKLMLIIILLSLTILYIYIFYKHHSRNKGPLQGIKNPE